MIRFIVYLGMGLFLLGCSKAQIVKDPQKQGSSKYAPINERENTAIGVVKYADSALRKRNRERAYKKMYEICKGKYKIVREERTAEGSIRTSGGVNIPLKKVYIYFQCMK